MKAVIFVALLLALATADYTPNWTSCSDPTDSWQPTAVTLDNAPTRNEQDGIHACGTVQDDVTVGDFQLKVKLAGVVVYTGVVQLDHQEIVPGSQYCFNYTAYIPPIALGTFDITFELRDDAQSGLGCVELALQIGSPEKKFTI